MVLIITALSPVFAADLIFTAPPRESPEDGRLLYKPLADYLSNVLGQPVVYEHPQTWRNYEKKMKDDSYDIIFDGPHFAAWRINTRLARPLVKLRGSLLFVLVVNKSLTRLVQPQDFIGKRICTLPAPNLGALTLFSMYPHPARQPDYVLVNGGFKVVAESLTQNKCDAAILRNRFYESKTSNEFKSNTRIVNKSLGLTNQGITLSSRISEKYDNLMIKSLTIGNKNTAISKLTERFGGEKGQFVQSTINDYENQNLLIENSIFGWD